MVTDEFEGTEGSTMYDYDRLNATRGYFYTSAEQARRDFEQYYGVTLPTHWVICDRCRGNGGRALGGAAFTSSEWAEACNDDPEFSDNYFSGRYDSKCEDCDGSGKVREVDLTRLGEVTVQDPEKEEEVEITLDLRKEYDKWLQDARNSNAESLAEYRMGA